MNLPLLLDHRIVRQEPAAVKANPEVRDGFDQGKTIESDGGQTSEELLEVG